MNKWLLCVGIACATVSISLLAHHSTAMFDMAHPITMTGKVTSFDWANPHSYLRLEVTTPDGKVEAWDVETHAISLLARKGWTRRSFTAGDVISVTGGRIKDGAKLIRLLRGTKADGWKFYGDDFSTPPPPRGGK